MARGGRCQRDRDAAGAFAGDGQRAVASCLVELGKLPPAQNVDW